LAAAQALQQQGRDFVLLERCPTLGGLTRTVEVGEFCFDYTGHFLHLCRYATPEDIPYANLHNAEWEQIERRSCCFVAGKFVTAPIQYNLAQLPPDLLHACVESYDRRPNLADQEDASFRNYMVSGFGQVLADAFLIPQNEKTMAISLDRLSKHAVRRFFPAPNEELVRQGMSTTQTSRASSYNSRFWYPKNGGIGKLVQGLRMGLDHCMLNQDVTAIDLNRKELKTATGRTLSWDELFCSIPLKTFCEMTAESYLTAAAQELSHSSTVSFNIGMRGSVPQEFSNIHWIYVPDRSVPFYRVGFYSNIGPGICTPGHNALYVEVGLPSHEVNRVDLVNDLQPRVIRSLEELGWVRSSEITCVVVHVMRHAYVHHTPERDRVLSGVFARLKETSVFPIGRYGLWDYTSMEDSMESARAAVIG